MCDELQHSLVEFFERNKDICEGLMEAWIEKELWEKFTHQEKMMCVVEETTVIALERFLIPGREKYATAAYMKALQKVCTSLTSGWFRDFTIWNWADLRLLARVAPGPKNFSSRPR